MDPHPLKHEARSVLPAYWPGIGPYIESQIDKVYPPGAGSQRAAEIASAQMASPQIATQKIASSQTAAAEITSPQVASPQAHSSKSAGPLAGIVAAIRRVLARLAKPKPRPEPEPRPNDPEPDSEPEAAYCHDANCVKRLNHSDLHRDMFGGEWPQLFGLTAVASGAVLHRVTQPQNQAAKQQAGKQQPEDQPEDQRLPEEWEDYTFGPVRVISGPGVSVVQFENEGSSAQRTLKPGSGDGSPHPPRLRSVPRSSFLAGGDHA